MRVWFHVFPFCPNTVYLQETFYRNVSLIVSALSLVNSICCLCLSFDIYLIEYFMANYNCLCLWPRMESLIQYQTSICLDVIGFFFIIFNWRMITLQCCIGFGYTTTGISYKYTYIPSLLNLPRTIPSPPPPQVITEHQAELPELYSSFPLLLLLLSRSSRVWLCATP